MTGGTIQSIIMDRLDKMDDEIIEQGKAIARIEQHLANNIEQKKHDWQRLAIMGGWLLTIIALLVSKFVK